MVVLDTQEDKKITTNDIIVKTIVEAAEGLKRVSLKFLEIKKRNTRIGDWVEYYFVLDCGLTSDTATCLASIFQEISDFLKKLTDLKINSIGLQETKCDDYSHLYYGMYILKDVGADRNIPEYDMTKEIIDLIKNDEL